MPKETFFTAISRWHGALAASPTCFQAEVDPWCKALVRGHPDWGLASPSGFRPTDWLVAPKWALKRRARQPPPRQSEDVSWVLILRQWRYRALSDRRLGWDVIRSRWLMPSEIKQHPPRCSSFYASHGTTYCFPAANPNEFRASTVGSE